MVKEATVTSFFLAQESHYVGVGRCGGGKIEKNKNKKGINELWRSRRGLVSTIVLHSKKG